MLPEKVQRSSQTIPCDAAANGIEIGNQLIYLLANLSRIVAQGHRILGSSLISSQIPSETRVITKKDEFTRSARSMPRATSNEHEGRRYLFKIRIPLRYPDLGSVAIFAVNFSLERLEHVQQMKLALLSHRCHLRPEVRVVAISV
jgi:hypothetical protein